jgi:hypothetical protein
VLVMFVVLWPLDVLVERALRSHGRHELRAQVVLEDLGAFESLRRSIAGDHLKVVSLELDQAGAHPTVSLQLAGRAGAVASALRELQGSDGVLLVAHDSLSRLDT